MDKFKYKVGDEVLVTLSGTVKSLPDSSSPSIYDVRFYGNSDDSYGSLYIHEDEMEPIED